MNNKLNEFIIKHNDFYSILSEEYKLLISDLDFYGELDIIKPEVALLKEEWLFADRTWSYLYVGKKDNFYYLYRCQYGFYENTLNISKGILIKIKILQKQKDFKFI